MVVASLMLVPEQLKTKLYREVFTLMASANASPVTSLTLVPKQFKAKLCREAGEYRGPKARGCE